MLYRSHTGSDHPEPCQKAVRSVPAMENVVFEQLNALDDQTLDARLQLCFL